MVRKYLALALASAFLTICFGCADELNAPITTDEAPVPPPSRVTGVALDFNHVELSWAPSSQPIIVGYNVYRREVGNGTAQRLNGNRIEEVSYLDGSVREGRVYEYRVTALSNKGKESRYRSIIIEMPAMPTDGSGKVADISSDN